VKKHHIPPTPTRSWRRILAILIQIFSMYCPCFLFWGRKYLRWTWDWFRRSQSYEPGKSSHGLPYDPFKSIVIPRPIGWISTTSVDGIDNLAPFSQFTNVAFDPPTIMWVATVRAANRFEGSTNDLAFCRFVGHGSHYKNRSKDSVVNARETGEFVWNLATWAFLTFKARSQQLMLTFP
jgi:hypothetical protein